MERHQLESCPVIAETNISVLRVAGDKVYKTKQPRTFPFVDQKSLTDRQRLCHQEVELNRRFSPDVYVGVEDITDGGETVDVAVVMERMSSERSLTRLLEAGVDVEECVKDVARQMAIYHQSAPRSAHISEAGTYGAVKELWRLSLQEMEAFVPSLLDPSVFREVSNRSAQYLAGRQTLFDFRVGLGLIVDGHGDLLADDIYCLKDGPRLLDCLEFDERFRFSDVLLDLAFLAMDLKRLGHAHLAKVFVDEYVDLAGEHHPTSLTHHYIALPGARALQSPVLPSTIGCCRSCSAGQSPAGPGGQQFVTRRSPPHSGRRASGHRKDDRGRDDVGALLVDGPVNRRHPPRNRRCSGR